MEMIPHNRASRTTHHVRKTINQWFQCATKAKNDDIEEYYQERVLRIKNNDTNIWKDLVHDIEIDDAMNAAPKVLGDNKVDHRTGAIKQKAKEQLGPVGTTPNSAERNP